ncbi:MAG: ABC transporter permease subunit [Dehalococcoidia bacterium]
MFDVFDRFTIPVDDWVQTAVDWVVTEFRWLFQYAKWPVEQLLDGIDSLLQATPELIILALIFLIAWRAASIRVAAFSVVALSFVGFLGLWPETMTTLAMVISAVLVCVLIGVPLGIAAARSDLVESVIRPVLDAMQTTPAFVYLVPVVMLFSVGTVAGVIATIIFASPPIIRLTNLGIRQVDSEVVEAARAFGATSRQILTEIQIPLALRTIMAGMNQTLMLAISMVVIAAIIGAGGLGVPVFEGLNSFNVGRAAVGGIGIVILAIIIDRITQAMAADKT